MPRRPRQQKRVRGTSRGSAMVRLRFGFIIMAMVLSVFGARLLQLQGIDPKSYAAMAAAEGTVELTLPAERGTIVDRNGQPLAASVEGLMIVADPLMTADYAPELATILSERLDIDYIATLERLRTPDSRFQYIARRVPSTIAREAVAEIRKWAEDRNLPRGYQGIETREDPIRDYPARDVAANLLGFMGGAEKGDKSVPRAGLELTFDELLSGKDGTARYEVGAPGTRIPLGENTTVKPQDGQELALTIDADLQWYVQRVLRNTVEKAGGDSGVAIALDSRSGEVLALADHPTFDANAPLEAAEETLGSRAMSDVYEPGSVQKVLTFAGLIDAGKITPETRITVPSQLRRADRVINDHWQHGKIKLTATGALAKSSNIGTILAASELEPAELHQYLTGFGLGRRTSVGVRGETAGIVPDPAIWSQLSQDTISFGQGVSVNALQMAAAINTIANDGVRVSPSLIRGKSTTSGGLELGSDLATSERVVSTEAARQTAEMMEKVLDPEDGVAAGAAVPGYRVAGKTGTAQRVGEKCKCYDGTFTVSFAGFAPADDPRFTVYVVVQNPTNGGGGGSVAGPAFAKIMGHMLRRYAVAPTGTEAPDLPVEW